MEIELVDVSLRRASPTRSTHVLESISMQVKAGEAVGIMGRSGVGKSTIINLIAGYLAPTSGLVRESGRSIEGPGARRLVVFQDNALWPWLNVGRNVALGLKRGNHAVSPDQVEEMLERLGLANLRTAYPAELSGGMAKRVELVRAIAAGPRVLMLDEALRSVDISTKQTCIDLIHEFRQQTGAAVIVVSHDVEEIIRLCSRVVILEGSPAGVAASLDLPASGATAPSIAREELLSRLGYRA